MSIVSYSFVSITRTHSRVVSRLLWSKLSCYSDSRWFSTFISCIIDLCFFSVIVNDALAVLKSDNLVEISGFPVIVEYYYLKLSRGRAIVLAVPPLGDLLGFSR